MFFTEHLEGRIRYETDKVVCIDVYLLPKWDKSRSFLTQVFINLKNEEHFYNKFDILHIKPNLSNCFVENEIKEGVAQYLNTRKKLNLD